MGINVYTGLMGSGKSYEVVAEVIVPAIAKGRRVVTNVDGIDGDKIRAYIEKNYKPVPEQLGEVVHVTNGDVALANFFPYYDDKKGAHTDTIVQPGDLVCIDEAWRFWPATGANLLQEHKSFFLEHRHFTNEQTGVACDLVLMIQDMSTLNRFVKNVVAFHIRTHKKISLGMPTHYSVSIFEGNKQSKAARISVELRKYRKDIFPLYSSFKGGADGKIVNVDKRQNMLARKKIWMTGGVLLVALVTGLYSINRFFHPKPVAESTQAGRQDTSTNNGKQSTVQPTKPAFSDTWRIVGTARFGTTSYVVIADEAGRLRYESPSMFVQMGPQTIGEIDGAKVTRYSGAVIHSVHIEGKK
ncbi:zonular occludens toxin domain-containing protein [Herbaspirillum rubrisubalbicans]|uniref:Zonula occludens toxin n=1 Tax=Herbaspirillum rubrisubalbicans TaxID=80842 RepID=A0AAD0XFS9_9BURK|nr:zonular occludens toxin domain-containing protein [Herbaspirillum rubrisubalbicans]AYR24531.1 zonula occludens toxin [Herbaspirillum rubrisubalbicans]